MRTHELQALSERGLRLYALTQDPLTFSAAQILAASFTTREDKTVKLNEPQRQAANLLERQLAAYEVLYTTPLV